MGVILLIAGAEPAVSYIDPGGVQLVWGSIAPIIGVLGVLAAGSLWIFRRAVWALLASARKVVLLIAAPVARIIGGDRKRPSAENPK